MSTKILGKPVFKPMRKGRRRKVKCTYELDEDDKICDLCTKYDRQCVKQGYVADKNIKAHVVKAQSLVEKLSKDGDYNIQAERLFSETLSDQERLGPKSQKSYLSEGTQDNNIFLKLFDIGPLSKPFEPSGVSVETQTQVNFNDPGMSDQAKLVSAISDEPEVLKILDITSAWWTGWRDQVWALRNMASQQTLANFVKAKIATVDPVAVAIGLMCLSQSLLMVRTGIDDETIHLKSSPRAILDKILAVIDEVILSSNKYTFHEEVILVILLRGKVFAEDSQARRAMLHIRKALHVAQIQGLGIPGRSDTSLEVAHDQQAFLGSILEVDRFMCMVFGFPYVKDVNFSDRLASNALSDESQPISLRMRAFRRITAIAAQHVTDRNSRPEPHDQADTISIAYMLSNAAAAMPQEWWNPHEIATQEDQGAAFESLMAHLWFWTTKMFTFLPAVFDSTSSESNQDQHPDLTLGHETGHTQCLDAARNLIQVFTVIRDSPSLSVQLCNCDDFMSVLASCIILVSWMQNASSSAESGTSDTGEAVNNAEQFENDMMLVEHLKDIFRYRAFDQGGSIAKQGLTVLETLSSFFESDVEDNSSGHSASTVSPSEGKEKVTTIMLPYFGTVHVQLEHKVPKPQNSQRYFGDVSGVVDLPSSGRAIGINGHGGIADPIPADLLVWDDWSQFMFDNELDQDWNKNFERWDLLGQSEIYT